MKSRYSFLNDIYSLQQIDDYLLTRKNVCGPLFQTFFTGMTVASLCYPIEVLQTWRQFRLPMASFQTSPFTFTLLRQMLISGFINCQKVSLIKNSVIVHGPTLHTECNRVLNEKESLLPRNFFEQTLNETQVLNAKRYFSKGLVTGFMGFMDTMFTAYHCNKKVRQMLTMPVPDCNSFMSKIHFSLMGFNVRLIRNVGNATCITGMTLYQEFQPRATNSASSTQVLTDNLFSLVMGAISGIVTTPFDIIYKYSLKMAECNNFTTPTMSQAAKAIYKENGLKGFTRGSGHAAIISAVAFWGIRSIDYLMNQKFYSSERVKAAEQRQPKP